MIFLNENYIIVNFIVFLFVYSKSVEQSINYTKFTNKARRILRGNVVQDTRPYMVYLRPALNEMQLKDANWLCGGMIIHEQYILTSAACIEDAKHFYVVSGTNRWVPAGTNDDCISNGAKRAIWKCVPKNYDFDGDELNNIRWMIDDIAVVKVEDEFNFEKRVRGCDFIPKKISFNNQSVDLEKAGTVGSIAGWGSVDQFGDIYGRATVNSPDLLETDVVLISKKNCKKRWPERYHYIIDDSMICAKDGVDSDSLSQICIEQEVNCKELVYSDEDESYVSRRFIVDPDKLEVHTAAHRQSRRRGGKTSGGFCENDHGGPLVVGHGPTATVVGIISACLTTNITQKCYGPFLYTSVWRNRNLITCAIEKNLGSTCKKYLRSKNNQISETTFDWSRHPEGPAKSKEEHFRNFEIEIEMYTTRAHKTQTKRSKHKG